jgi:DnaD/phage-associated family protein
MARPPKEGLDYFPHDTDAAGDEKIEALRALHGNDGYAFYFILLERVYRTRDCELDVSDPEMVEVLAKKVGVTPEAFGKMLETALKFGCFDRVAYEQRGVLTSDGIKKRAAYVTRRRVSCTVSAAETPQETRQETKQETVEERGERKQKEIKEKKSTTTPTPPPQKRTREEEEQLRPAIEFWQHNVNPLGTMKPHELNKLTQYLRQGLPGDCLRHGMELAVENGSANMRYVTAIYDRWLAEGLLTLADVLADEEQRRRRAKARDSPSGTPAPAPEPPSEEDRARLREQMTRIDAMAADLAQRKAVQ